MDVSERYEKDRLGYRNIILSPRAAITLADVNCVSLTEGVVVLCLYELRSERKRQQGVRC